MRLALAWLLLLRLAPWSEAAAVSRGAAPGRPASPSVAASVPALPALPSLPAAGAGGLAPLPPGPPETGVREAPPAPAEAARPSAPAAARPSAPARLPEGPAVLPAGPARAEASGLRSLEALSAELSGEAGRPESGPARPAPALDRAFDLAAPRLAEAGETPVPAGPGGGAGAAGLAPARGSGAASPPAPPSPPSGRGRGSRRALSFLPHLLTGLNLASGVGAILLAAQGLFLPAAGLILLANAFDAVDGRAARALGVDGPLGVQLDSLADVVSFGAAPAVLVYTAALSPWGLGGFAVAAAFAFAGAYRLARFNVQAQDPSAPRSDSFTGLPIPGGAGVVAGLVLALGLLPAAAAAPVAALVTLAAAAAMVSRLPYPAFKKGGLKALALPASAAAALAGGLSLAGLPALIPAAAFGLYLMTGPAIAFKRGGGEAFQKELKRKAFHQSTLLYLAAYHLIGPPAVVWAMAGWLAFGTALELARIKVPAVRDFLMRFFGGIIRPKESDRLSGAYYVTLGMFAVMALYGSNPALVAAAALMLAWGDAASVLVGMRFDWIPFKVQGVQRSLGGVLAGFAVALGIGLALGFSPLAAAGAALAFTAVDVYPVKPDDNLWIPIVGATALHVLSGI